MFPRASTTVTLHEDGGTTTVFTLPAGYRPALRLRFAGVGNVTPTGAILIETSGNVDIYFPGGPVLLVLNCSFMAEA